MQRFITPAYVGLGMESQKVDLIKTKWNADVAYETLERLTFKEVEAALRKKVIYLLDSERYESQYKMLWAALEIVEQVNQQIGVPQ